MAQQQFAGVTNLTVTTSTDDTDTTTTIFQGAVAVAVGRSRRRKGDVRDPELGASLALARAFYELGDREMKFSHAKLEGEPSR